MHHRGQASIEWLGALAVVAVLLTVVAGLARGEAVAGAVVRQLHRALCVVRRGVCDLDRRPCVVTADATEDEAHVNLGIFRIGRREVILRERRSDGTVLVTFVHDTSGGWDVGVGADAWIDAAGHEIVAGSAARAALLASLGGGETWAFGDARQADVGMAYLSEGEAPPIGVRAERIVRSGVEVGASAQGGSRRLAGALRLDARLVAGTVVDERTGRRTHVVTRGAAGQALLRLPGSSARGEAAGEERLSVTTDARGRPLELTVVRTGELDGALSLPRAVQPIAGVLVARAGDARRWVVEQRLDLTEPENLRAAQGLLDATGGPAAAAARAGDSLRRRLATAGVTEARTYGVVAEDSGIAAHLGAGMKVGGRLVDRTDDESLVDARVRGIDGQWRERGECLSR